jgi:serine/threonine-protein kinase
MTQVDFTGRSLGGYRILRKLGQGGMAVVYKAHEESLSRVVALKVIAQHLSQDEKFITRFQREAQAAAQLHHPNIVQIYAIGHDQGVHFFSMEYVKGRSLAEIIEEEGFLTAGRALPIIAQAAEALAVAHDAGIVHRAIKPANIVVDGNGRVKVADFGIAQMATATRMTQSGMLVGTPEFISPEQCRGEKLDGRSDIYSLGVTLYQLLAGRTPFDADTPAALVFQIVEGPKTPVSELNPTVSADVAAIVARMMHIDRNQRFQSAEDLGHALRSADTHPVTSGGRQHPAPGVIAADLHADPTVAMTPGGDTATAGVPAATEAMEGTAATAAMAPPDGELPATAVKPSAGEPTVSSSAGTAAATAGAASAAAAASSTASPAVTAPETRPERPSPAAQAYAGKSSNRGALLGLAAAVLILITVLVVGWQLMGTSGAEEPFDPTVAARPPGAPADDAAGNDTEPESGAEAGHEATSGAVTDAGGGGGGAGEDAATSGDASTADPAADGSAGGNAGTTGNATTSAAAEPGGSAGSGAAVASGGGADAPTTSLTPQPADPAAGAAAPPAAASVASGTPAGGAQTAVIEQPAFTAPPDNAIVAETSGEYEYAEQVHAWMEREFGDQDFEVIDFPSSPYGSLQEAARFHVVTTARLVGTEQLEFFGNVQTQYTVSLVSRVTDLSDGRTVVGPETETVKYTSVNMQQNLQQAVTTLARRMAGELRTLIRTP